MENFRELAICEGWSVSGPFTTSLSSAMLCGQRDCPASQGLVFQFLSHQRRLCWSCNILQDGNSTTYCSRRWHVWHFALAAFENNYGQQSENLLP